MPGEASTCSVCNKEAYKDGLCKEHYHEEIRDAMSPDWVLTQLPKRKAGAAPPTFNDFL